MEFGLRKKQFYLVVMVLCYSFLAPSAAYNQTVRVSIVSSSLSPQPGDTVTVSINVDMSDTQELLGSFKAILKWCPDTLLYIDYLYATTEGFANPIVNDREAAAGQITFGNFNPQGKGGVINIFRLRFSVAKLPNSTPGLKLIFSEMYAAKTFVDLLPFIDMAVTNIDKPDVFVANPEQYKLYQNYPNPFNDRTNICFSLPKSIHVHLALYNIFGQKLKTLMNASLAVGYHVVNWDGSDDNGKSVSSGIYIYQFKTGDFNSALYLTIVK